MAEGLIGICQHGERSWFAMDRADENCPACPAVDGYCKPDLYVPKTHADNLREILSRYLTPEELELELAEIDSPESPSG